ncbi:NAD-dependent epimerase/dehydratase family protein [uncultured Psychrobacter sp.]|uniref:NAD-dependent epimerase/dehydratase family protein n=1 Tax=uncultured Psychrobacter sp. TaxID=259303 RepID=UPI0025950594|nr:NAD-dependent epimerase/dehydratase family protein [uncultured Psychrobacter sp.]
MNILIAGGAGFIGGRLCEHLLNTGHNIICIDSLCTGSLSNINHLLTHKRFTFINLDITKNISVDFVKLDQIYHLACPASPEQYQKDPLHTIETNYVGTRNLLDLAKQHEARFLLTSTSEIYGDPEILPQSESYNGNVRTMGPRSCYDEGKRIAESLVYIYSKEFSVDTRIARIFNTYGPTMQINDGRVISNFIVNALTNKPLVIYGKGSQSRSFCYIDDMVNGVVALMNSQYSEPVNLGLDNEVSILEVAEKIIQLVDTQSQIVFVEGRIDEPQQRRPLLDKAKLILKWEATVGLEEGLLKSIDYYRALIKE